MMVRYSYPPRVAYGVVAAGGTLGILIPPSGPMVVYGVVSDTSIGALFMAGVVPGLMLAAIFAVYCMTAARFGSKAMTPEPRASGPEIVAALRRSFWALLLPVLVLGGMYFGVFTATEAAAIGALGALLIAMLVYRNFSFRDLWLSAQDAARNTAMLFMILAAAAILGNVLTKLRIPNQMVDLVLTYGVSQIGFLCAVMALIFVLGMFLETISIILITTPVVLPVLTALKIHPVWYGILLTINLELALITPPVGMNLFALKAITRAPLGEIIAGVGPYVLLLIFGLGARDVLSLHRVVAAGDDEFSLIGARVTRAWPDLPFRKISGWRKLPVASPRRERDTNARAGSQRKGGRCDGPSSVYRHSRRWPLRRVGRAWRGAAASESRADRLAGSEPNTDRGAVTGPYRIQTAPCGN